MEESVLNQVRPLVSPPLTPTRVLTGIKNTNLTLSSSTSPSSSTDSKRPDYADYTSSSVAWGAPSSPTMSSMPSSEDVSSLAVAQSAEVRVEGADEKALFDRAEGEFGLRGPEGETEVRGTLKRQSEVAEVSGEQQDSELHAARMGQSRHGNGANGLNYETSCGFPEDKSHAPHEGDFRQRRCMCEFLYGNKLRSLEEEAKVEFHWYTFVKEFLYHMLYPLSIPAIYFWEGGFVGLENRLFVNSPFLSVVQLIFGICLFSMFVLSPWYLSPDIYITTAVWVVRNLVIATKYGFVSKPEMEDMRLRKLPWEVHADRTLLLSWLNPIPARVLKRQLLLAAVRQKLVQCTDALRLVPGASQRTVCDIMHLMSITSTDEPLLRVSLQRRTSQNMRKGLVKAGTEATHVLGGCQMPTSKGVLAQANGGQTVDCASCLARGHTETELEARWINICMQAMTKNRRRAIPNRRTEFPLKEVRGEGDGQRGGAGSRSGGEGEDENDNEDDNDSDCGCSIDAGPELNSPLVVDGKLIEPGSRAPCPALDLPVLLFAVYLIQQSMSYLGRRRSVNTTLGNESKVRILSAVMSLTHAALPFVVRAIAGRPPVLGGMRWYHFVVSIASFIINYFAMSSNMMFMLAGVLDMRRRAFCAHLLNRLLRDGHYRPARFMASPGGAGSLTLSAGLDGSTSRSRWSSLSSVHSVSSSTSMNSVTSKAPDVAKLRTQGSRGRSSYGLGLAIDFSHPESVIAWWTTRVLVQDFGLVFHMRVKYYASYFAVYCMLLTLFLVIELLSSPGIRQVHTIVIVVYDLMVFCVLLGLMVFPAGETNDLHHRHGETLIDKKLLLSLHLRKNRGAMSVKEMEQAQYAAEAIDTLSHAVAWDNQITKVMVVGFSNGSQWVGVLLGAMGVAITIAAQQFTNRLKSSTGASPASLVPPPQVT